MHLHTQSSYPVLLCVLCTLVGCTDPGSTASNREDAGDTTRDGTDDPPDAPQLDGNTPDVQSDADAPLDIEDEPPAPDASQDGDTASPDVSDGDAVNTQPSVEIRFPDSGRRFPLGQPVTVRARVADLEDSADQLRVTFHSSIDGELLHTTPLGDGSVSATFGDLSAGQHELQVQALDTAGATADASVTVVIEGVLPVPTLSIQPELPSDADTLLATLLTPFDPVASGLGVRWSWSVNGTPTDIASRDVPADRTAPDEVWRVVVTLFDDGGRTSAASASVQIARDAPSIASVSLTPLEPLRGASLSCGVAYADGSDVDSSAVEIRWWVRREEAAFQRIEGGSAIRSADDLLPGDGVLCEVLVAQPGDTPQAARSNLVTVVNGVPTIGGLAIVPAEPVSGDRLECQSTEVQDPDGDLLTRQWAWFRDDVEVLDATSSFVTTSASDVGSHWRCGLTVDDGWGGVEAQATEPVLVRASDARPTVTVDGSGPCGNPRCSVGDGGASAVVAGVTYGWLVNGVRVVEIDAVLDAVPWQNGDHVTCEVTFAPGETPTSASWTIDVARPQVGSIDTTPAVRVGETVVCTPRATDPACDDRWTWTWAWSRNNFLLTTGLSGPLATDSFAAGDEIRCLAMASYGGQDSPPAFSDALVLDAVQWSVQGTQAGARFGWDVAVVGDLNGDEFGEVLAGAPGYDDADATSAGAAYLVYGRTDVESLTLSTALQQSGAVAWVGESGDYDLERMVCGTYTFPGGCPRIAETGDVDAWTQGPAGASLGWVVDDAGDVDGDGVLDLLITAPFTQTGDLWTGRAYVLAGSDATDASVSAVRAGDAPGWTVEGECGRRRHLDRSLGAAAALSGANGDLFGLNARGVGDMNGDGLADVVIQSPHHGGRDEGAVYLVYGQAQQRSLKASEIAQGGCTTNAVPSAGVRGTEAGMRLRGHFNLLGSNVGATLTALGDINGDGLDDMMVNSGTLVGSESAYIVFGGWSEADVSLPAFDATIAANPAAAASRLTRIDAGPYSLDLNGISAGHIVAGQPVGGGGDINGDGYNDLAFAMISATWGRSVYVLFGKPTWSVFEEFPDLAPSDGLLINDLGGGTSIGGLAIVPDMNGDGYDEVVLGTPALNGGEGAVWIVYGRPIGGHVTGDEVESGDAGFLVQAGDLAGDFGRAVAGGDLDNDGLGDVVIGAPNAGAAQTGAVAITCGGNRSGVINLPGGPEADELVGTSAGDRIVAGRGDDLVYAGGGADVIYLGGGDDSVVVMDTSFFRLRGGPGEDTLVLAEGCDDLDLVASRGRVSDMETIELNGQQLRVGTRDVLRLSRTSNRLMVRGTAGSVATVASESWYFDGLVEASGRIWITLSSGNAELWIEETLETEIPPSMPPQTFHVGENSPAEVTLATVTAQDPDGTLALMMVTGGTAAGFFDVDATTGALRFTGTDELNYERFEWPWTLELTAVDSDGLMTVATMTVVLVDVPEYPVFVSGFVFAAEEGQADDVVLATLGVRDPDIGDSVTFRLDVASQSLFEISASGALSTRPGRSLDYETQRRHEITVTAEDTTGLATTGVIELEVLDLETLESQATLRLSARDRGIWGAGAASQFPGFEGDLVDVDTDEFDSCSEFSDDEYDYDWPLGLPIHARIGIAIDGTICTRGSVAYSAGEWNGDAAWDLDVNWPDGVSFGEPFVVSSTSALSESPSFWGETFSWSMAIEFQAYDFRIAASACYSGSCRDFFDETIDIRQADRFVQDPTPWVGTVAQTGDTSFELRSGAVLTDPYKVAIDWDAYWIVAFRAVGLPTPVGRFETVWNLGGGATVNHVIDYLFWKVELGYVGNAISDVEQTIEDVLLVYTLESGRTWVSTLTGDVEMTLQESDDVDDDGDVDVEVRLLAVSDLRHSFSHVDSIGSLYTFAQFRNTMTLSNGVTYGPQVYGPIYDGGCIPTSEATRNGAGSQNGMESCLVMVGTELYAFDTSEDWTSTAIRGSFQIAREER